MGGAVGRGVPVLVGVGVPPVQIPSSRHQLSVAGSKGDAGGQSRVDEIVPIAVYFVLLNTTDVPIA